MENVIIVIVLLVIIGFASRYIIKAKKNGQKCIGCPDSCCSKKNDGSGCGCGCGGCNEG